MSISAKDLGLATSLSAAALQLGDASLQCCGCQAPEIGGAESAVPTQAAWIKG